MKAWKKWPSHTGVILLCAKGSLILHGMVGVTYPMNAAFSKMIGAFSCMCVLKRLLLWPCNMECIVIVTEYCATSDCFIIIYINLILHLKMALLSKIETYTVRWLPTIVIMQLRIMSCITDGCIMNLAWGDQNIVTHSGLSCSSSEYCNSQCHVQTDSCIMNLAWEIRILQPTVVRHALMLFSLVTVNCVLKKQHGTTKCYCVLLDNQHV